MAPLESMIQDFVNNISEGFFGRLIRVLIFLVIAAAIFGIYFASQFRGLRDAGSMEYAQLARNMSAGKGYVTSCIRPADISYLSQPAGRAFSASHCPDIRNQPFFPAVLSLGFKLARTPFVANKVSSVLDAESSVIVPVCVLFTVLTGFLVYLIGLRLFGRLVAVVSVIVFFLSKSVLDDSISGLPGSLTAFLVTAISYAAVSFRDAYERNRSMGLLVYVFVSMAILSTAAILTSYKMAVFVPVMAFFMVAGFLRRGFLTAGVFLVFVCLLVSPWLIRNWKVSGNAFGMAPYEALHDTAIHKEDSFDRQVAPVTDSARIVRTLKVKFMSKFPEVCEMNLRSVGNGLIICLFLVAAFHKFEREEVNQLKGSVLVVLLLMAAIGAFFSADAGGVFKPFLPLVIIFGVAFFFAVLERDEFADMSWKMLLTVVLVMIAAMPAIFAVAGRTGRIPYPPYYPPFVSYVSGLLGPEEIMCTDIPWATAWYGSRTSVLIPQSVDDFKAINAATPMKGLYLTTVTGNRPFTGAFAGGPWQSWMPVLNGKVPGDFPLTHGIMLPKGRRDQLFLTDRDRWTKSEPQ